MVNDNDNNDPGAWVYYKLTYEQGSFELKYLSFHLNITFTAFNNRCKWHWHVCVMN